MHDLRFFVLDGADSRHFENQCIDPKPDRCRLIPRAEGGLADYPRMEPLERNILDRLAKAREHRETNVDLTIIWRECGNVDPIEFAHTWGSLEAGELVHGELYATDATVEGLGKITTKGEEELKK